MYNFCISIACLEYYCKVLRTKNSDGVSAAQITTRNYPAPPIPLINFFPLNDVQKPSSLCVPALDRGEGPSLCAMLNRWGHGSCDSGFNPRMKSFTEHVCSRSGLEQCNQHLLQSSRRWFGKGVSLAGGGWGWARSPLQNLSGGVLQGSEEPRRSRQKEEGQSSLGDATTLAWCLASEGPTGGGGVQGWWGQGLKITDQLANSQRTVGFSESVPRGRCTRTPDGSVSETSNSWAAALALGRGTSFNSVEYTVIHWQWGVNRPLPPTLGSYLYKDCEVKHHGQLEFKSNIGAATLSDTAAVIYWFNKHYFIQWFPNQTRCLEADTFAYPHRCGSAPGIASTGQRPGVLLPILQCTGQPYNKELSDPKGQQCWGWETPVWNLCVLSCFSHVPLCDAMDCSLPGSSAYGIL